MKSFAVFLALVAAVTTTPAVAEERGQYFRAADIDASAALDQTEFRSFIKLLANAGNRGAKRVVTYRLYHLAWMFVDSDGDGLATREELFRAGRRS